MRIVLLGICILAFDWMANSEAYLPENTKRYINKLNDHYTSEDERLYDGHPIFRKKLEYLTKNAERGEQKLLMTIILDAYNRIFTRMQNETQDESVRRDLKNVMENLNKLKEHYFSNKNDLKKYASEVLALKESDPLVQRKALFELETVYSAAAKLIQNQRRRRQAKRAQRPRS
ncbi:interferon gamma isoform X2 [Brachyhypopomus gauderio]|uniref:interferon gamma isoform X2 n=1 Tax=Brachyhypopomus gauderio TaxID=698409 RepID=UPI004041B087